MVLLSHVGSLHVHDKGPAHARPDRLVACVYRIMLRRFNGSHECVAVLFKDRIRRKQLRTIDSVCREVAFVTFLLVYNQ
jgi:hypothetical protein